MSPEQMAIRSQLRVRTNIITDEYEVFTTAIGTNKFKWFKCSEHTANWYVKLFKIKLEKTHIVDIETGELANVYES